jgi:hypothetical protein
VELRWRCPGLDEEQKRPPELVEPPRVNLLFGPAEQDDVPSKRLPLVARVHHEEAEREVAWQRRC